MSVVLEAVLTTGITPPGQYTGIDEPPWDSNASTAIFQVPVASWVFLIVNDEEPDGTFWIINLLTLLVASNSKFCDLVKSIVTVPDEILNDSTLSE